MIDFNTLIDKHLSREGRGKEVGRYWPSEAGACIRKSWYTFKQPKETLPEIMRIFEAGNLVHDFVAEVLRSEKTPEVELLKSELPVKIEPQGKGFVVSGRIDDVILLKAEGRTFLVEVKSTKSIAYQREPSDQHMRQLQLYMHATGVHNGIVLYIEKNTLQAKSFEVLYDPELVKETMAKFERLHKALVEDSLPVAEAKAKPEMKWMCAYCDYRQECDAAGNCGV